MKYLISLLFLLLSFPTLAENDCIDPKIVQYLSVSCTLPTERADGSTLDASEIEHIELFKNVNNTVTTTGMMNTSCMFELNLAGFTDGNYTFLMKTTDTDGRVSEYSEHSAVQCIKEVFPPLPPSLITINIVVN